MKPLGQKKNYHKPKKKSNIHWVAWSMTLATPFFIQEYNQTKQIGFLHIKFTIFSVVIKPYILDI